MKNRIYPAWLLIILCLIVFVLSVNSQINDNSLINTSTPSSIDSKKVLGIWNCIDSLNNEIEFIDSGYEIELIINTSHPYYFPKDSIGFMSSSGYYPLWPPPGCSLLFITEDTLKITYSPFFDAGISYLYVKKNKLIRKK